MANTVESICVASVISPFFGTSGDNDCFSNYNLNCDFYED